MTDQHPGAPTAGADLMPGHRRDGPKKRGRRPPRSPAQVSVEVVVVSLVFGALMGIAWNVLNPEITGEIADGGVAVPIAEARQLFDRVAIFSLLGAGIGLVVGVVFGVRHRRRPVTALLAMAAGGLAGSLLAWGVGVWTGPSLGGEEPGTVVEVPIELEARAALFAWPLIAVVVVTVMALFRDDRAPWVWNGRRGE